MTNKHDDYHGIIVKEGIGDQSIFDGMDIIGQKTGKQWTLLKIRVEAQNVTTAIHAIKENLLTDDEVPYYAHLYRNDELIVIFPNRVFHVSPNKDSWTEVISYGLSLGVPGRELDFRPCRFEDETF